MDMAHHRKDRSFAILVSMIVTICLVFAVWAHWAEVDISASAVGKIVPDGQVKTVQVFEIGIIKNIRVKEGERVDVGDVLVELDATDAAAEHERLSNELLLEKIRAARLESILSSDPEGKIKPPSGAPRDAILAHQLLRDKSIGAHRSALSEIDNQISQRVAGIAALKADVIKLKKMLPIVRQQAGIKQKLFDKNFGTRVALLERQERLFNLEGELAAATNRLNEASASLRALKDTRLKVREEFTRDNLAELTDAQYKISSLAQLVRQANDRLMRHTISAPVAGVVQELKVHTLGGVVEEAAPLMTIVPEGTKTRIDAYVENADIGFVKAGQAVDVKVVTFDFRRYGTIRGRVSNVSSDAVGAPPDGSLGAIGGTYFKANIELVESSISVDGNNVSLSPGMTVNANILIGKRRIVDFILDPISGIRHDAFKEQ